MKLICVIPSFDEAKTIEGLVRSVRDLGYDVLVVDDGSKDATAALARGAGAEVMVNEVNRGKGTSLRRAFDAILTRPYDGVIIMDADGQHLPGDIRNLVDALEKTGAGMVVGNRMRSPGGMPAIRWLTNMSMSLVISCWCRQMIPDSQCGFRIVTMEALRALPLETEKFEIESEMLIAAARRGFKIASAPITTVYEGQVSAIHPLRDTVRFFRFLFKKRLP